MIYKHIVPTGLRSLSDWIYLFKLMHKVRNPYRLLTLYQPEGTGKKIRIYDNTITDKMSVYKVRTFSCFRILILS